MGWMDTAWGGKDGCSLLRPPAVPDHWKRGMAKKEKSKAKSLKTSIDDLMS